ncbi:hypothetical protein V2J09_022353 [Rumex salicifolius]
MEKVRFNNVCAKNTWFYYNAMRVTRGNAENQLVERDVADATCALVITLFDEIAEELIKKKSVTLLVEVGS